MSTQRSAYLADGLDDDECGESAIHEELQLLEAIYVNELTLRKDDRGWPSCISVRLHPATGDVQEQQYVCLTLELSPPHDYPMSPPGITIRNPRGLAEEHINSLHKTLEDLAEERPGYPMLYELIECAKDSLTQGNVPHGHCVICRDDFNAEVEFTRTACYHYFHCDCLLRYVKHCLSRTADEAQHNLLHSPAADEQVVCPICRAVITYDLSALENVEMNPGCDDAFRPNASVRKLQRQMAALFEKQVVKGGIIDVEAERIKFLVPEGHVQLPSVQEDIIGLAETEASCGSELPINDTSPQSAQETKHCDIRNRKFGHFPSHRGRGRGRGRVRGHGREVGRDLHVSDGDRHLGCQFSGRRRNERNLREDDRGRNETNREVQNSETRNKTNLIADQHSARTATNQSARRNETNVRGSQHIEKTADTNVSEDERHVRRSETRSRGGRQFDRASGDLPLENHRHDWSSSNRNEKSETTWMPSSEGISRTQHERSNCGVPSSHTDALPRDRPQSANRRVGRGRRGWIGRGSARTSNRNPNPRCRVDYSGINEAARKTTECSGNRNGTSAACDGERERIRGGAGSLPDSSGKCPPPGFRTCKGPPPGFGKSSVGS